MEEAIITSVIDSDITPHSHPIFWPGSQYKITDASFLALRVDPITNDAYGLDESSSSEAEGRNSPLNHAKPRHSPLHAKNYLSQTSH